MNLLRVPRAARPATLEVKDSCPVSDFLIGRLLSALIAVSVLLVGWRLIRESERLPPLC